MCVVAVHEHGRQVEILALDNTRAVQLDDWHAGLVIGPGWEVGSIVRANWIELGVVHLDVHGRVFKKVRHPVEDTIASVVVLGRATLVRATLVFGGSGEGKG